MFYPLVEKTLSKIYRKEKLPEGIKAYILEDFSKTTPGFEPKKKYEFVPDYDVSNEIEFIPGGFDFDYEGGLSRSEILDKSKGEAERILNKANEQASEIQKEAETKGFEQGKKEGFEAGTKGAGLLIDSFTKLVEEISRVRKDFYKNCEEEMIHLAVNVAKTVIGTEINSDPKLVQSVIKKAVLQLQNREEMTIAVNPDDLAEAEKFRSKLSLLIKDIDKVTFKSDHLIARGGCVVETNIGSIDARIETQLESIQETFLHTMNEANSEKNITQQEDTDNKDAEN